MQPPAVNDLLHQRKRTRAVGVANLADYKHITQRLAHHAHNQPLSREHALARASAAEQHNITVLIIREQRQVSRIECPLGNVYLHLLTSRIVQKLRFA